MDFFISYNHSDRPWARWIAWQLEAVGYKVVLDEWDFSPGSNFITQMHKAATADRTIALLSPAYLTAPYPESEWTAAFDPTSQPPKLVPVRVRECKPDGLLAKLVYIDLVGKAEDQARALLLTGVKGGRAKPASPPSFPAVGVLGQITDITRPAPPRYPKAAGPVTFSVEHGDITTFPADTVVLKYAQSFYGADRATARRLIQAGIPEEGLRPAAGDYRYVDVQGAIAARHALFVGTKPLARISYRDIRDVAVQALTALTREGAEVWHLAMTIHGPGFGLDEMEAVLAMMDGLLDCVARETLPAGLRRISIVEIDDARVRRLRRLLEDRLGGDTFRW